VNGISRASGIIRGVISVRVDSLPRQLGRIASGEFGHELRVSVLSDMSVDVLVRLIESDAKIGVAAKGQEFVYSDSRDWHELVNCDLLTILV